MNTYVSGLNALSRMVSVFVNFSKFILNVRFYLLQSIIFVSIFRSYNSYYTFIVIWFLYIDCVVNNGFLTLTADINTWPDLYLLYRSGICNKVESSICHRYTADLNQQGYREQRMLQVGHDDFTDCLPELEAWVTLSYCCTGLCLE